MRMCSHAEVGLAPCSHTAFEAVATQLMKEEGWAGEQSCSFPRTFPWWSTPLGVDQLVADSPEEAMS